MQSDHKIKSSRQTNRIYGYPVPGLITCCAAHNAIGLLFVMKLSKPIVSPVVRQFWGLRRNVLVLAIETPEDSKSDVLPWLRRLVLDPSLGR